VVVRIPTGGLVGLTGLDVTDPGDGDRLSATIVRPRRNLAGQATARRESLTLTMSRRAPVPRRLRCSRSILSSSSAPAIDEQFIAD